MATHLPVPLGAGGHQARPLRCGLGDPTDPALGTHLRMPVHGHPFVGQEVAGKSAAVVKIKRRTGEKSCALFFSSNNAIEIGS